MPALEVLDRRQKAVYWPLVVDSAGRMVADANGQPRRSAPVEIAVRWEDVLREIPSANGGTTTISAEVETNADVPVGAHMWRGGLNDLPGTAQVPEADVMQVYSRTKIPDLKARDNDRRLSLTRVKDSLPTAG